MLLLKMSDDLKAPAEQIRLPKKVIYHRLRPLCTMC